MSIKATFSIMFFKIWAFELGDFQSGANTEILKLMLPNAFVPFMCLTYLSSSSTFYLISLSISSFGKFGDDRNLAWAAGCWSGRRGPACLMLNNRGDPESFATGGEGWLLNIHIITDILYTRFLSSFFMSLNSVTEIDDWWIYRFSTLV